MLKSILGILRQMGPRYVGFRTWHEFRKRSGFLKRDFPTSLPDVEIPTLNEWRENSPEFPIPAQGEPHVPICPDDTLKNFYDRFKKGDFQYFNGEWKNIGRAYDWVTNPATGYKYKLVHWTEIPDLDPDNGDIKYTWEKSRFSYLITLIRYDHHFNIDIGELVFQEIEDWLEKNPLNLGPNYLCSQEISLRILNWTFALYYYKNNAALTQVRWEVIMQSIYGQLRHVRANIHFSRIAVRNNHAITETLMLYLGGLLFPWFPESAEWKKKGKVWLEQEIVYQLYDDGTYIQHSHNYQRVFTQLLTYAITISGANGERFSAEIYKRAAANYNYLLQQLQTENGFLPNYGSNDGALFFPLNTQHYRDYRPQLNALAWALYQKMPFPDAAEEAKWLTCFNISAPCYISSELPVQQTMCSFPRGGIYSLRYKGMFVMIKCSGYRDRPAHADNLHLDLWLEGENILVDDGSYRYNPEPEYRNIFGMTPNHNTVSIGGHQQMKKGPRFIWYNWNTVLAASWQETDTQFIFNGKIEAFGQVSNGITHQREVAINKADLCLLVLDRMEGVEGFPIHQHWHLLNGSANAISSDESTTERSEKPGFYSSFYGQMSASTHLTITSDHNQIKTTVKSTDLI